MEPADIERCLSTMSIIVDTREQPTVKSRIRYKKFECEWEKHHIEYGDYTFNFELPDGSRMYDTGKECIQIIPPVVVERKSGLVELSGNLTERQQSKHKEINVRNRFEAELKLAKDNNSSVYLLIEDSELSDIIHGNYDTRLNPKSYFHTLTAFMARYELKIVFCKSNDSGTVIKEILYRELKERLTRGDYG